MRQKLLCPKCKKEVVSADDLACCEYCNAMTVEPFCLKENNVRFVVCSVEDNSKVFLTIPFNLLQQPADIDENYRIPFLRSLIKCPYIIIYDVVNNVVKYIKKCICQIKILKVPKSNRSKQQRNFVLGAIHKVRTLEPNF